MLTVSVSEKLRIYWLGIAIDTELQVVILRLPLVYGPGVKANFKSLLKIAGSGMPLPV